MNPVDEQSANDFTRAAYDLLGPHTESAAELLRLVTLAHTIREESRLADVDFAYVVDVRHIAGTLTDVEHRFFTDGLGRRDVVRKTWMNSHQNSTTTGLTRIPMIVVTVRKIGEYVVIGHPIKPPIQNRACSRITAAGIPTAVCRCPACRIKIALDGTAVYVPANAWPHVPLTPANRAAAVDHVRRREIRVGLL